MRCRFEQNHARLRNIGCNIAAWKGRSNSAPIRSPQQGHLSS